MDMRTYGTCTSIKSNKDCASVISVVVKCNKVMKLLSMLSQCRRKRLQIYGHIHYFLSFLVSLGFVWTSFHNEMMSIQIKWIHYFFFYSLMSCIFDVLLVCWSFDCRTSGASMRRNSTMSGFGGTEKIKDARPLHDKSYVQQCIRQLHEVKTNWSMYLKEFIIKYKLSFAKFLK